MSCFQIEWMLIKEKAATPVVNELNYLPYLVQTFWQQTANSPRVKNILFVRASLLQQRNKSRSQRTISSNTEHWLFCCRNQNQEWIGSNNRVFIIMLSVYDRDYLRTLVLSQVTPLKELLQMGLSIAWIQQ